MVKLCKNEKMVDIYEHIVYNNENSLKHSVA